MHDDLANRPARPADGEAETNPTSAWLADCLEQLETDPARAHAQAQIRRDEVHGADRVIANHCLGMAASELRLWADAQRAFLAAREETPAEETRGRARFAVMAGNAALAGGDPEAALGVLTIAGQDAREAASAPLEALAAVDAARALVALDRADEALAALAQATRLSPDNSEGWLLTATLLRRLDRFDEAQSAIERAAAISPRNPEIGLEAGVIAALAGREDAARTSWQSVIAIQPDSHAAAIAEDYLAQLGPVAANEPQGVEPSP